jgi:hypothetical protein
LPKLAALAHAYRERPCVRQSTVDDFDPLFIDYVKNFNGYIARA